MTDNYPTRVINGRQIMLVPLTFGRWRLCIGKPNAPDYEIGF